MRWIITVGTELPEKRMIFHNTRSPIEPCLSAEGSAKNSWGGIMKNLFFALTLVCTTFLATTAQAQPELIISAPLNTIHLDSTLTISDYGIEDGHVALNLDTNEAVVTLYVPFHCPEGLFCAQVMPEPVMIRLSIVSSGVSDECGTMTYYAVWDARPVDGDMQSLIITDNTQNHCQTLVALSATEVEYVTISAGFGGPVVSTRSIFLGSQLSPNFLF